MQATTLYLANGLTRTVKGRAEDIGNTLKARTMGADDGVRQYQTTDGDWITIHTGAVLLAEEARQTERRRIGFWTEETT